MFVHFYCCERKLGMPRKWWSNGRCRLVVSQTCG